MEHYSYTCACAVLWRVMKPSQSFHVDFWYNLFFAGDFVTKSHLLLGLLEGRLRLPFHVILEYEYGHLCPIPVFLHDLGGCS